MSKTRVRTSRLIIPAVCLLAMGGIFMVTVSRWRAWREYRHELGRPAVTAEAGDSRERILTLSRFTPREFSRGGFDVFRLHRTADPPPNGDLQKASPEFEILGVIKSRGIRVVVRVQAGKPPVILSAGEEVIPGTMVVSVTTDAVIIRGSDGRKRRFPVFRLDESAIEKLKKRSQP